MASLEAIDVAADVSSPTGALRRAEDADFISVLRFLNREMALLDRREYGEWFGLWTEPLHYRVTAQLNRDAGAGRKDYAIVEEDAAGLKMRIDQMSTPKLTHAENPPSMVRRFFSGLEVYRSAPEEVVATANVLIFRTRPEMPDGGFYAGARTDIVRRVDDDWRLASRVVRLDQAVLFGGVSIII